MLTTLPDYFLIGVYPAYLAQAARNDRWSFVKIEGTANSYKCSRIGKAGSVEYTTREIISKINDNVWFIIKDMKISEDGNIIED